MSFLKDGFDNKIHESVRYMLRQVPVSPLIYLGVHPSMPLLAVYEQQTPSPAGGMGKGITSQRERSCNEHEQRIIAE